MKSIDFSRQSARARNHLAKAAPAVSLDRRQVPGNKKSEQHRAKSPLRCRSVQNGRELQPFLNLPFASTAIPRPTHKETDPRRRRDQDY